MISSEVRIRAGAVGVAWLRERNGTDGGGWLRERMEGEMGDIQVPKNPSTFGSTSIMKVDDLRSALQHLRHQTPEVHAGRFTRENAPGHVLRHQEALASWTCEAIGDCQSPWHTS